MIITNKAISRRTVLRGFGASLALPLLDAMVPAFAPRTSAAAAPVIRFGVVYVPNGIMMQHWMPDHEGEGFELKSILKPFEPFREQLLILSGLKGVESDGPHARASTRFLTGVPSKRADGVDLQAAVSMDQLIAREQGAHTQLASLELAVDGRDFAGSCDDGFSCAYTNTIAWRTPTTPLPTERDPRAVFERLFGTTGSTDPKSRLARMKRDKSILDFVGSEVASLERAIGPQDKAKIDEYLEAVRDIERRIQMAEEQNTRELPVVEQPVGVPGDYAEHARLMMDLLALAYQTDLTRVSTFMLAREVSAHSYPEIGVSDSHHPLSHHQDEPAKLERLHKINEYHFRQFAYLVNKLSGMKEGDGTMLDHTLFLYGTGISDSNTHFHDDLPIALVGGAAAGIKGGRYVRYAKGTPLANMHVTVLDKLGVKVEKLGDSTGRLDRIVNV